MSTTKKRSSLVTGLLFVLAIGLLLFSAVGSARAALNVQSEILTSDIRMLDSPSKPFNSYDLSLSILVIRIFLWPFSSIVLAIAAICSDVFPAP